jgi:hypothetical protein
MYQDMYFDRPCVLLLDRDGQIGCARMYWTHKVHSLVAVRDNGIFYTLYYAPDNQALDALKDASGSRAVVIPAPLFSK